MTIPSKNVRKFDFFYSATTTTQPMVAISACLNGKKVRYDGKDKALATRSTLSHHLQLIEQCPEVDAGLAVPRPAVQLIQTDGELRARGRNDDTLDVTDVLLTQRGQSLKLLEHYSICGYIFKSKSPSCGVGSVPVFDTEGEKQAIGNGLHADYFLKNMPWIAIVDENLLHSSIQCEYFIFLCYLIQDVQLAISNDALKPFNNHYQQIIKRSANTKAAQTLRRAFSDMTDNNNIKLYQVGFKESMEQFIAEQTTY